MKLPFPELTWFLFAWGILKLLESKALTSPDPILNRTNDQVLLHRDFRGFLGAWPQQKHVQGKCLAMITAYGKHVKI